MEDKHKNTLALLEAMLDSTNDRIKDPYYSDQVTWLEGQAQKIKLQINAIKAVPN